MNEKKNIPRIRFAEFNEKWVSYEFGNMISEYCEKTTSENEDVLLSCSIEGMFLNSELFSHQRGLSNIGYLKIKKGDLILSAQNLHLGNANVNLRFLHGIISPAYKVYDIIGCDSEFLHVWIKRESTKNFFSSATTAGASLCRKNIEWDSLYSQAILLPEETEQKLIAKLLIKLDKVISFKEWRKQRLQSFKASMLEKMFPKDGADVPEVRFKEFTGAWEHHKLDNVLMDLKNNTLSRSELSMEKGAAKNIHYGDVLVRFGENLNIQTTPLPNITDKSIVKKYKKSFLQDGDVIVADTAEDKTVGKCTEIIGINNEVVIAGLHTIPYRPLIGFAPGYLGYYMNSPAYHNQLLPFMQGIKVTSISKSSMKETTITYPQSMDEQKLIGKYFLKLDNLIALQQQELNKLQSIKKSLLEKMFV